jgi:predicted porin
MKKSALLLGLLSAVSTMAIAQGSNPVTLYGRMNVTLENQKAKGSSAVNRVVNNASRLGVRGVEDLGGGLKAIFQIESGLAPDDASGGALASRDSWVGLRGGFGEFRIGRQTTPLYHATVDAISFHNHDTGTSSDALFYTPAHGTVRNNNSIYFKTGGGGANFELQHSLLTEAASAPKPRHTNATVTFGAGIFSMGAGFGETRNHPDTGNTRDNALLVQGTVNAGGAVIGLLAERSSVKGAVSDKANMFRGSVMVPVGASEFHLNYGRASEQRAAKAAATRPEGKQWTVAYNYNLSKRTKAYTFVSQIDPKGPAATRYLAFGLRHNF